MTILVLIILAASGLSGLAVYFALSKGSISNTVGATAAAVACSLSAVKLFIDAAIPHIK